MKPVAPLLRGADRASALSLPEIVAAQKL